jgi:hypothetical protein
MVTPIDAVSYGIGFDEAGSWHEPRPAVMPARIRDEDPLNASRGLLLGLAISGALWTGIIVAGHTLLTLLTTP